MSAILTKILEPLSRYYGDPDIIELRMKQPGTVVLDRRGSGLEEVSDPSLTLHVIERICQSLANKAGLTFDPDQYPQLSTVLPEGHRFECMMGASVQTGVSLAIRCKHVFEVSWEAFGIDETLLGYITEAAALEKNIIISGATNTGKTTFVNKFLKLLPANRRVITVEDTPELFVDHFWNGVSLLAAREGGTGSSLMSWRQIYDHLMRSTPDNIIFGEISTQNAFAALGALNSGVTGFLCTIHAESPEQVVNRKFDQNTAWSGQPLPRIPEFLEDLVDSIIQIKRDYTGKRQITDIWEPRNNRYILKDGQSQTVPQSSTVFNPQATSSAVSHEENPTQLEVSL
ncbi:MAG: ATPase, T2SS/T4P/T4SS family [Sneathiella sp.]